MQDAKLVSAAVCKTSYGYIMYMADLARGTVRRQANLGDEKREFKKKSW